MTLLHPHRAHRARQVRWVLPLAALLFTAAVATLLVQYRVSDQAVGTEFFRAHKTVAHTGVLLRHGVLAGLVVLTVVVGATALLALRFTHRIVRPVHTIHRALDALATAAARDGAADPELPALVRELDGTLDFFRLEPRRVVREDAD